VNWLAVSVDRDSIESPRSSQAWLQSGSLWCWSCKALKNESHQSMIPWNHHSKPTYYKQLVVQKENACQEGMSIEVEVSCVVKSPVQLRPAQNKVTTSAVPLSCWACCIWINWRLIDFDTSHCAIRLVPFKSGLFEHSWSTDQCASSFDLQNTTN
jgi:hypothetical protein